MTGRSPAAKKHRMDKYRRITAGGRRVACDRCKVLHAPPVCTDDEGLVRMTLDLPPYVARALHARVVKGERTPWIVRLIRRELDV